MLPELLSLVTTHPTVLALGVIIGLITRAWWQTLAAAMVTALGSFMLTVGGTDSGAPVLIWVHQIACLVASMATHGSRMILGLRPGRPAGRAPREGHA